MSQIEKITASISAALVITFFVSICSFGSECAEVRENVVRLHILANSDRESDQQVKLAVRDALLESGEELFSGSVNTENAAQALEHGREKLTAAADEILERNGKSYTSDVILTEEYFPTRSYEGFTMPAGKYLAVKVILGKGEGHNWWCVMYPPLCLPAATDRENAEAILGEDGVRLISSEGYEIRFKLIEIYENIKNKCAEKKFNI